MSGPLRSKQGCWTCRLRKKKCDELQPSCDTCESLGIPCYGFGPKPAWMDDAEQRRAIMQSLSEDVKRVSRRKTAIQLSRHRDRTLRPAAILPRQMSSSQSDLNPASSIRDSSHRDPASAYQDEAPLGGSHATISAQESVLLMHFLDTIFALQYPVYNPGPPPNGGRGWILALLLRTKPLYHAAIALSAYHRQTIGNEGLSAACRAAVLDQQESHLDACINIVSNSAQQACPGTRLGTAASVIQLIFFDLYTGPTQAWKVHLRVLVKVYNHQFENSLIDMGLSDAARKILLDDLDVAEEGIDMKEEVKTFRTLGGTMVWLDLISSVTTGEAPHLLKHHNSLLAPESHTRFQDFMGCKNQVLRHVGRIAELHAQKQRDLEQGNFRLLDFHEAVIDLGVKLQIDLSQEALDRFSIDTTRATSPTDVKPGPIDFVTSLFTRMAIVYLHLVAYDFQNLQQLETHVYKTIEALQGSVLPEYLEASILPIFIIGLVSAPSAQPFFRQQFSSSPLLNHSLRHRAKLLPILEDFWKRRQQEPKLTWKNCLDLTSDILIV